MKRTISCICFALLILISYQFTLTDAHLLNNYDPAIDDIVDKNEESSKYWFEQTKVTPQDENYEYGFGQSVAIENNYALISGGFSVFVFKNENNVWKQSAILKPNDEHEWYFCSVDITDDYAILGGVRFNQLNKDESEVYTSAFFYRRTGSKWIELTQIPLSNGILDNHFIFHFYYLDYCNVDIEEEYAIAGTFFDDINGNLSGSAYIMKRKSDTWSLDSKILPSNPTENDWFGLTVSIDNQTVVIGSIACAVYVFNKENSNWIEKTILNPKNNCCYTVEIKDNILFVGSYGVSQSYPVMVYEKINNNWINTYSLLPSTLDKFACFGHSITFDGEYLIIGAYMDEVNESDIGSAYIYKYDNCRWLEQGRILPSNTSLFGNDFGTSVSIDNEYAICSDSIWAESDTVYIYHKNQPPEKSSINGSLVGEVNENISFTLQSNDTDNHLIQYLIDWGDGSTESTQYFKPEEICNISHCWNKPSNYQINISAIDQYGLESNKSTYLSIQIKGAVLNIISTSMTKNKVIINISNTGNNVTKGFKSIISIKGGIFGLINFSDSIESFELMVNETKKISFTHNCFGIGWIDIIINCSVNNGYSESENINGFILASVILLNKSI